MTCKRNIDRRRSELAEIHILKKDLGLDEETYRDMISAVTSGHRSAGDLDQFKRSRLLEHMRSLKRNKPKKKKAFPGRPHNCDDSPQLKKIEALLTVNKKPWSYADGIAKQMFKKDRIGFCNPKELSAVITALVNEFGDDYVDRRKK